MRRRKLLAVRAVCRAWAGGDLEALGLRHDDRVEEGREAVELPGCSRQRLHQCGKPQSSLTQTEMQVACRVLDSGNASNINLIELWLTRLLPVVRPFP